MLEPRRPRYDWGLRVQALADLVNDGSYPDRAADELLVAVGDWGEIVQIGHHPDANVPIYLVEFGNRLVVGCFEEEISPGDGR